MCKGSLYERLSDGPSIRRRDSASEAEVRAPAAYPHTRRKTSVGQPMGNEANFSRRAHAGRLLMFKYWLPGGVADAGTQTRRRQRVNRIRLGFAQGANRMIAGHHLGRRRDGILLVEHGVRHGDGQIARDG